MGLLGAGSGPGVNGRIPAPYSWVALSAEGGQTSYCVMMGKSRS